MIMTMMMTEDRGAFGAAVLYRKQDDGLMVVIKVRDDGNVDDVDDGGHDDNDGGEEAFSAAVLYWKKDNGMMVVIEVKDDNA